ncbi:MAG TPA: coproporphyrinogen III oxidase, partial [Sphingobacterium sp.]|nr:coproporphyrinogen III oxidase [Sphingobacterium sp.]
MEINSLISKYNVPAPRYTSYPTVPFWENDLFGVEEWKTRVARTFADSRENGISIYVHLPFCESLCTYCGCNTRITKNHKVEDPYIHAVLQEWTMYKEVLGGQSLKIAEIHLGGGTPTFFTAENLQRLISGLLDGNVVSDGASFSFEAHPANTTEEHLQILY